MATPSSCPWDEGAKNYFAARLGAVTSGEILRENCPIQQTEPQTEVTELLLGGFGITGIILRSTGVGKGTMDEIYSRNELDQLEEKLKSLARRELGLARQTVRQRFVVGSPTGKNSGWIRQWSFLGELLKPIAYTLNRSLPDFPNVRDDETVVKLRRSITEFAGSHERLIWDSLDLLPGEEQDSCRLGERVLRNIVQVVDNVVDNLDRFLNEGLLLAEDGGALNQREVKSSMLLVHDFRWSILGRIAWLLHIPQDPPPQYEGLHMDAAAVKRVWLRGALDSGLPVKAIGGLFVLTREITENLMPDPVSSTNIGMHDSRAFLSDPVNGLPPLIVREFVKDLPKLIAHRDKVLEEFEYSDTGIDEQGATELERLAFPYIFDKSHRHSVLVLAPTSSGKSRLGLIAVVQAVWKRKQEGRMGNAIILAPTKALVNQIARDVRNLLRLTEGSSWIILEGSRDYPHNDDKLRFADFDIAVVIPEKLSSLIRNGMSIGHASIILVDELQHIVDGQRGHQLESLMMLAFDLQPRQHWMGVSASLADETVNLLQSWFANNGTDVIPLVARHRPVPLIVSAVTKSYRIAHKTHIAHHRQVIKSKCSLNEQYLRGITDKYVRNSGLHLGSPLALALSILAEHTKDGVIGRDAPSILFFTHGQTVAERLAEAFRKIMENALSLAEIPGDAAEFLAGRFNSRDERDPETKHALHRRLRIMHPSVNRDAVSVAVRYGVGVHTGSLDGASRELMEEAFREGFIRILFATDTLRLGINLPADVVINTDLLNWVGGPAPLLLDKDAMIQRLGRAGRLGITAGQGHGYIIAPSRVDDRLEAAPAERLGLAGSAQAPMSKVQKAVTDVEKLWTHYLSEWSGGAEYVRPLRDAWLDNLVLQSIDSADGHAVKTAYLPDLVSRRFKMSLLGASGAPSPGGVVQRLEFIGAVYAGSDGMTRLTAVGRSIASNGVGVENVTDVERIARSAQKGAGPLTLLFLACQSPYVTATDRKIVIKLEDTGAIDQTLSAGRDLVRDSASEDARDRKLLLRHFPGLSASVKTSNADVIGTGPEADKLRSVLDQHMSVDAETITALIRAVALLRRSTGVPFNVIARKLAAGKVEIRETALSSLADASAFIINAASDLLGIDPTSGMEFRSLEFFANEVEIGMPAALAPFRTLIIRQCIGNES